MILRSNKALSVSYNRILFGLSIADIVSSIAMSTSSLLSPTDTPHHWISFGNTSTCTAQGFLFLVGSMASDLYITSLQLFFLCSIKYEMEPEGIQRRVEPFLHCIPILFAMTGGIVSLATQSINASGAWCFVESYPRGCTDDTDVTCIRGNHKKLLKWIFGAAPAFITFMIMSIATILIYRKVRNKEISSNRFTFRASTVPSNSEQPNERRRSLPETIKSIGTTTRSFCGIISGCSIQNDTQKSHKMLNRSMQYYFAYLLSHLFPLLANITKESLGRRIDILFILQNTFYPLQGFYNLLVFTHPNYKKIRTSDNTKSALRAFYDAIKSYGQKPIRKRPRQSFSLRQTDDFSENPSEDEEQVELSEESCAEI